MRRSKRDVNKATWDLRLTEIFIKVMQENAELNADTIMAECRKQLVPPQEASTRMAGFIRRYKATGYLRRTGRFTTSTRNDSSAIPWYISTIYGGAK